MNCVSASCGLAANRGAASSISRVNSPGDIQQVEGKWTDYGGENLSVMATHMAGLGAAMVYSGPTSGTITGIVCTGSSYGKTCVVLYMIRQRLLALSAAS